MPGLCINLLLERKRRTPCQKLSSTGDTLNFGTHVLISEPPNVTFWLQILRPFGKSDANMKTFFLYNVCIFGVKKNVSKKKNIYDSETQPLSRLSHSRVDFPAWFLSSFAMALNVGSCKKVWLSLPPLHCGCCLWSVSLIRFKKKNAVTLCGKKKDSFGSQKFSRVDKNTNWKIPCFPLSLFALL